MVRNAQDPTLESTDGVVHDNCFFDNLPSVFHERLVRRVLCHIVVSVLQAFEFSDKSILDAVLPKAVRI